MNNPPYCPLPLGILRLKQAVVPLYYSIFRNVHSEDNYAVFLYVFCVYHSFFQLASFYRIELFQPCIKAFPYRHFCFLTSVFSLFRSKVTELLFQKGKLVAVCQTNFSRDHAGDFLFLRKKRLFDFFLGIDIQQLQLYPTLRLVSSPFRDES